MWKARAYERTFQISHSTQNNTLSTFEGAQPPRLLTREWVNPGGIPDCYKPIRLWELCGAKNLDILGIASGRKRGRQRRFGISLSAQKDSSAPKPREKEGKRHGSRVLGATL